MRFLPAAGLALASLAAFSLAPTGANGARTFHAFTVSPRLEQRPRPNLATPSPSPTPCASNSTQAPDHVVGIAHQGDVSYAEDSGILAGANNIVCGANSAIGGGAYNAASKAGAFSFVGAGARNTVGAVDTFIGAGTFNGISGDESFIGSGNQNSVTGILSFIGAGELNKVSGNGSFIGAGNVLYAGTPQAQPGTPASMISGADSFIGAGDRNAIYTDDSFIGAGQNITIAKPGTYAAILGGAYNATSGEYSTILGGYGNVVTGEYGVVAGGNTNSVGGTLGFAAGYHAMSKNNGSFVWSDYSSSNSVYDTAANQFIVRASGGVDFYSNEGATAGVALTPGSGTWASLSDRNAKTAVVPVDGSAILAKVAALPLDQWQYRSEPGVRHVGPMAQDFYAAFGVGVDDRHITSIDEDGVALAAIKSLNANIAHMRAEQRTQDARKDAVIAHLRNEVRALDAIVTKLSAVHPRGEAAR